MENCNDLSPRWENQRSRSKRPQSNVDAVADDFEDSHVLRDGPGPMSRSSVNHVSYIVSKFDETKKALVREIGFEGILQIPQITKVDRKFTVWLLSKLDTETRTFVVNGQCVTDIVDFQVSSVLGIPCGSRAVCELEGADRKKLNFIHHCIGADSSQSNSLIAAEANVVKVYQYPLSDQQKDNFKVSFVVWVMGHLLAPTKKHNIGSDSFWGALTRPSDIKLYNWAEFVLKELVTAAIDVQVELAQNRSVTSITGCPILLQILYLDSVSMGSLNAPRQIYPRIKVYDSKTISSLIAADKACSASSSENAIWGSHVHRPKPRKSFSLQPTSKFPCVESFGQPPQDSQLVQQFSRVIRQTFGDKLSPFQSSAFNWFNARCVHHLFELNRNIEKDTIQLIQKLIGSEKDERSATPPTSLDQDKQQRDRSDIAHRAALSDPGIIHHGISYGNLKRRSGHYFNQQAKKRSLSFCAPHHQVDTLLTGSSYVREAIVSEGSESAVDSPRSNRSKGADFEPPSFDLGIDLSPKHLSPSASKQLSIQPNQSPECNAVIRNETPATLLKMLPGTPASAKDAKPRLLFTTPDHRFNKSSSSPGTLSKLLAEGALVDRIVSLEENIDINTAPWDLDFVNSPIKKRSVVAGSFPKSPWWYKYSHRTPPTDIVLRLFEDVSSCEQAVLASPWILHKSPRVIQVDGCWIQSILVKGKPLSYDLCDIIIRRLVQLDDLMYQKETNHRWRLFLESEFAMLALAGEHAYNRKSIMDQFIANNVSFKLEQCQMIVVPALILLNWCCYFFDFKDKFVYVVDPLFNTEQSPLFHQLHNPNVDRIAAALVNCIDCYFDGWEHNIEKWQTRYILPPISDASPHESGLLSLFYAREFDGLQFHTTSRESFEEFKKSMLYEILCLQNNRVKPPINFPISIDD